MENLDQLFDELLKKKKSSNIQTMSKNEIIWNDYLEGAEEVFEKLKFLNQKGIKLEKLNYVEFDNNLFNKGYFPTIRLVNSTISIKKNINEEFIKVGSCGKFHLMGEKHTYESFLKKLLS